MYTIAFTGHRPNKIGGYDTKNKQRAAIIARITALLQERLEAHKDLTVMTGGALGIDTDAAQIAYKLSIPYTVAAPCHNQDAKWVGSAKIEYQELLARAAKVVYIHDGPYLGPACFQKRNEYMVDNSDELVAIWDGSPSGTGNCVKYAEKQNKKIEHIDPRQYA